MIAFSVGLYGIYIPESTIAKKLEPRSTFNFDVESGLVAFQDFDVDHFLNEFRGRHFVSLVGGRQQRNGAVRDAAFLVGLAGGGGLRRRRPGGGGRGGR